jgi:glucosylceramidase
MKLTLADGSQKLMNQESAIMDFDDSNLVIHVSEQEVFQSMDGFGFALTGGSALHLNSMSSSARKELLNELFGQSFGELNFSFIRVSIGASDLDQSPFSYVDTQDNDLDSFALTRDKQNLIPIIKEILAINPVCYLWHS